MQNRFLTLLINLTMQSKKGLNAFVTCCFSTMLEEAYYMSLKKMCGPPLLKY